MSRNLLLFVSLLWGGLFFSQAVLCGHENIPTKLKSALWAVEVSPALWSPVKQSFRKWWLFWVKNDHQTPHNIYTKGTQEIIATVHVTLNLWAQKKFSGYLEPAVIHYSSPPLTDWGLIIIKHLSAHGFCSLLPLRRTLTSPGFWSPSLPSF